MLTPLRARISAARSRIPSVVLIGSDAVPDAIRLVLLSPRLGAAPKVLELNGAQLLNYYSVTGVLLRQ